MRRGYASTGSGVADDLDFIGDESPVKSAIQETVFCFRLLIAAYVTGIGCCLGKVLSLNPLSAASWFIVCTPFWIGNVAIAILQARVLLQAMSCFYRGRVVPSSERRVIAQDLGLDAQYTISDDETNLVTRSSFAFLVSIPAMFLFFSSELLMCSFLGSQSPSLSTALAPLLLVELVSAATFCFVKMAPFSGVAILLILLSTLLVALSSSFLFLAPIWALKALFVVSLLSISWSHATQKVSLRYSQLVLVLLYLLFVILTTIPETMLFFGAPVSMDIILVAFCGVVCGGVGLFILVGDAGLHVWQSRGFGEPLSLSLEDGGWTPSNDTSPYFNFALGYVCVARLDAPHSPVALTATAVPGETVNSDNYDSSGYDSAAFTDMYAVTSGAESS